MQAKGESWKGIRIDARCKLKANEDKLSANEDKMAKMQAF